MKSVKWTLGSLALFFLCLLFFPGRVSAEDTPAAAEGVYIEDVNVSGMTEEEISQAVSEKMARLQQDTIVFYVNDRSVSVTAGELGLGYSNPEVIQQALSAGRQGNVLQRFRMERYVEKNGPLVLELNLTVSADAVRSVVEEKCVPLNCDAVDMGLVREEDGTFTITPRQDGVSVRVEDTVSKTVEYMESEWHGGQGGVSAATDVVEAQGDEEQLALVQDVLGESSTEYGTWNTNRSTNISVGASKLNGIVLYPGEELSVGDTMAPFTAEEGYLPAASYEMGSVVDSYGGGICQVSTTLYLAVLRSELEVTERYSHSMTVSYVKPSMDAAIAEGVKDFKFVNNTDAPIYIEASAGDGEVAFAIYGHETRDPSRTVEFESETLSTTEPTTTITLDSSASYGSVTETSSGHTGSSARLWKIVYVNGEEQSREQINSSEYQMSPRTYTVGTGGAGAEAVSAISAAAATGDLNQVYQAISQYPNGQAPSE